jgi:hypothetical protein
MIFWLCLIVVTVALVGALSFDPRAAALLATIPASLMGVSGAAYRPRAISSAPFGLCDP